MMVMFWTFLWFYSIIKVKMDLYYSKIYPTSKEYLIYSTMSAKSHIKSRDAGTAV